MRVRQKSNFHSTQSGKKAFSSGWSRYATKGRVITNIENQAEFGISENWFTEKVPAAELVDYEKTLQTFSLMQLTKEKITIIMPTVIMHN
jgi:hypothetical protein